MTDLSRYRNSGDDLRRVLRRVLAGDLNPEEFLDLFGGLPFPPFPAELREHEGDYWTEHEPAPALVLAEDVLIVADWVEHLRSVPFFYGSGEAALAIAMLRRLAGWLGAEHLDPIPADIAGILEEIPGLMGVIYDRYDDGYARHFPDREPNDPTNERDQ